MSSGFSHIAVIDVGPLVGGVGDRSAVAAQIGQACRDSGFFYAVGHGVDEALQRRLVALSCEFFAQDLQRKLDIRMALGGRAWRGYFPVGQELTSGKPDRKEGIYFGAELPPDHPSVRAHTPMHGANLFPVHPAGLRETVLEYLAAMTRLGHALLGGIARSLDLKESYFTERYTADPFILFRIFNYPPVSRGEEAGWGVGEHTDYGVLTMLKQDESGGLQVKSRAHWIDAPPVAGSFVCNLGDMLERMTGGLYRSTPHRVRNLSVRNRLAFPFFFDPNFDAEVQPIELLGVRADHDDTPVRWDGVEVHEFRGTYGDYLLSKVSKVFPELRRAVLPTPPT